MVDDIPPPKADFSAPPPYELATKLPSYEEVQQQKLQEQCRVIYFYFAFMPSREEWFIFNCNFC
jgi:hypothetical protein